MNFEAFAPGAPYVAAVLVVGAFLWRVFVKMLTGLEARFDDRFKQIDNSFQQMESRFDNRFQEMESRFDNRFRLVENGFQHMESRFDNRFQQMESRFDNNFASLESRLESLDTKVDGLAADHHSLSRELSEFRGEMRGRLSMLVPPVAGET